MARRGPGSGLAVGRRGPKRGRRGTHSGSYPGSFGAYPGVFRPLFQWPEEVGIGENRVVTRI